MSHCHCHCHDHSDEHCGECCSSHHHHHDECCGDGRHHEASGSEAFLELADEAWMEVLKDKIKAHILANDTKMDELAKIISEANHARWKMKMAGKHGCDDFKQKLHDYFGSDCCNKSGGSCKS
jgi:hypothetical protein